jgi:hypothetical protein
MANSTRPADYDSHSSELSATEGGVVDLDERARKRIQVGLSARRPTAKVAPERPPGIDSSGASRAVLPGLLGVILLATLFLVAANIWDWFPSWWRAPAVVADPVRTVTMPLADPVSVSGYQLALSDDFSRADTVLAEGVESGKWRIEHQPTASSYKMEVWPNRVVWSLLDVAEPTTQRMQASVTVATHTPWGYAGIVNRYVDDENFYLFLVDGEGRFMVQLQEDGTLKTLKPWTKAEFLNPAGSTNAITVDDDGEAQRFYGNNMLLYEASARLPAGDAGVVGGSQDDGVSEISFDWIQLFDVLVAQ